MGDRALLPRLHLDCSRYDRVIVSCAIPEGGYYTLHAETDAGPRTRRGEPFGPAKRDEWLPLDGAQRIKSFTIEAHFPRVSRAIPGSTGRAAKHRTHL